MELLTKLGINWQLLLAQIVNFAIVVGVLSFFLYKPLLNLIDTRRERIRKAMEDAQRIENQAKEMEELRQQHLQKLDAESGVLFEQARKQAEVIQKELIASAKKEAEHMLEMASKRAEEERRLMLEEVLKTVHRVVLTMTEKILEREFGEADQKRITESLVRELPSLMP
ncbi:ATP synthase F0 subunit B [Candidatus Peribacteria bacterium RIFOXYC2_FULL_55_14]|nr:MAG: ATP synthase subunit b [Candidatus Peribacteria bacterium GW2011_GWB1_54_5]OGJ72856.1 MAG: ATP synthase F0 subunit B [Candidatus Peribacteria bacterium RIFOXYA1_FULL_56_14]OGJ73403.1 MAG: ATP synthase F0 subunit B [Candidatus Peribacteria bacterium RIFOXYA2_FULL_55_28]OGJ74585.1 MAG: ATP synthase F0 subunit B [Candidatus Peribacteria bacterium RIFOXYB1_FULL_54_35]OGJ77631.1 MAG: ATP synthase F0 subunit B [Candidatus Peribacteria bacterium RIFOXYB2_FULL_54_17]OGJ77662.1 MAG: ATP synthas